MACCCAIQMPHLQLSAEFISFSITPQEQSYFAFEYPRKPPKYQCWMNVDRSRHRDAGKETRPRNLFETMSKYSPKSRPRCLFNFFIQKHRDLPLCGTVFLTCHQASFPIQLIQMAVLWSPIYVCERYTHQPSVRGTTPSLLKSQVYTTVGSTRWRMCTPSCVLQAQTL